MLIDYLTKCSILTNNQYCWRSKHDTSMAVIEMVDKISQTIDTGDYSIGIFILLSKAFDTLDHYVLFDKLEHYGVRGTALNWLKSYLSNRVQFLEYNNTQSQKLKTTCEVPPGSILRPISFIICINDITNASQLLCLILFADDTSSTTIWLHLLNWWMQNLSKLADWFIANRLSLNAKKLTPLFSLVHKRNMMQARLL